MKSSLAALAPNTWNHGCVLFLLVGVVAELAWLDICQLLTFVGSVREVPLTLTHSPGTSALRWEAAAEQQKEQRLLRESHTTFTMLHRQGESWPNSSDFHSIKRLFLVE